MMFQHCKSCIQGQVCFFNQASSIARFIRDINMLKLVTDFEGEAWLVRYMDGQVDKLQLKFISDGWSDGKLDFMPNVGHIKRYGRLLF